MTTYQPGDLVPVAFPYTGGGRFKLRPALVLLDTGDSDIVVARVTTQLYRTQHDVIVADWQASDLLAPSVIGLHKLATLERSLIRRRLGRLPPADRIQVAAVLRQTYGAW